MCIRDREWRDTIFASQLEMLDIGFKANIIENHDEPRGASRYLPDHAKNDAGKKMLAATSLLPVSYTHLDVYKRQVLRS